MAPTFEVVITFDSAVYMLVDADTETQAQELADARFDPRDCMDQIIDGVWTIADAELVDDGTEEEGADGATG